MPLHPKLQEFLKKLQQMDYKPFEIMAIEDMRFISKNMVMFFGKKEDVFKVETEYVKAENHDFLINIYHPSSRKDLPVLLYFHPGGYIRWDINVADPICRRLANASNCTVISVNYRLAPEETFPAALEDGYTALCFAKEYLKSHGGKEANIAVMGDSSGGNLAAALTLLTRKRKGPVISYQVLVNPFLDYTYSYPSHKLYGQNYYLTSEALKFYEEQYFPKEEDRKSCFVSPIFAKSFESLPEALIITAEFDPVRDEGQAYAEKLRQTGIAVKEVCYKGMIHGFIHLASVLDESKQVVDFIGKELQNHFKGK